MFLILPQNGGSVLNMYADDVVIDTSAAASDEPQQKLQLRASLVLLERIDCWYDDVIKWKYFARHWPFVRGIHRWLVNSPHKGHWRGALMFSVIYAWTDSWVNNRDAGD